MMLAEAIEQVYAAFGDMPKPTHIQNEFGDLEPGEVKQLLTYPLRELSSDLMRSYLFDAIYRAGTWDDFRYFLPRLLEFLPDWEVEPEKISWRLEYANEQGFPLTQGQRTALHDFALSYWADMLPDYVLYAECYLDWGTLEPFGVTRAELLQHWREHPAGALAVAYLLVMGGSCRPEWPDCEVKVWLEAAFFAETDDDAQQTLSDALLILSAF